MWGVYEFRMSSAQFIRTGIVTEGCSRVIRPPDNPMDGGAGDRGHTGLLVER
jgi:hypothetical protein